MDVCFLVPLCEGFDIQAAGIAAAGLRNELHPSPQVLGFFFSAIGRVNVMDGIIWLFPTPIIALVAVAVPNAGVYATWEDAKSMTMVQVAYEG